MAVDQVVKFFHGASTGIQAKIDDNTINENDLVITSDTDELVFIDSQKAQKPLGSSKSKNEYEVQLGSGGSIGGLKTGDTIPAGTTLDELIKKLTQKSVPATYAKPGVTCRKSAGQNPGNYEVGTEIRTTIQGQFTKNDAGNITKLEILKDGVSVISGASNTVTSEEQVFTLTDGSVSFTAKATYGDGAIKNDNLGNPSPTGQITAGSITSSAVTFSGKRNLFYGTGVGSIPEITSEKVRALSGKQLAPINGTTFRINVAVGQQYIIFAYPSTLRDVSKVKYVETNDEGMAQNFTKVVKSIEGANGAAGADYKVYTYGMDAPAQAPMTFEVSI